MKNEKQDSVQTSFRLIIASALSLAVVASGATTAAAAEQEVDQVSATFAALEHLDIGASSDPQPSTLDAATSTNAGGTSSDAFVLTAEGPEGLVSEMSVVGVPDGQVTREGTVSVLSNSEGSFNYAADESAEQGSAALIVLHDDSAPTSHSFGFSVDGEPAVLTLTEAGAVVISTQDDEYVNAIQAPWAVDAAGNSLPTAYVIDGSTLTQHVDTTGAAFPVVADPQHVCDGLFCTVEFNRSETLTIKESGWPGTGIAAAGCALLGPAVAVLCGALGGVVTITATQAYNQGDCFGVRAGPEGTPFPVIYSRSESAYCR